MSIRNSVQWSTRTFLFLACGSFAFAGVHIVDHSGQGDFVSIQAAVDAAIDGDVILVRGGQYTAFTVDNKGLAIYADADSDVEITGPVQVVNVSAARTLVLSGLNVTGSSTDPAPSVALSLAHNAGALRFQKCAFTGGRGLETLNEITYTYPPAAHGVQLLDNPNVSFVGCTLRGGDAYMDDEYCYECTGGAGGHGVLAQSSAVALYDSLCIGGAGGEAGEFGGAGGSGYHALDWGGFASRSTFQGGIGGGAWDFADAHGGSGGNGLWLESSAGFHLLSVTYQPGAGGVAFLFPNNHGPAGQAMHGSGAFDSLPGIARVFVTNPLAESGGVLHMTVYGQPGDKVFVPASMRTSFKYKAAVAGVWLIPTPPMLPVDPSGVIPAGGVLQLDVPVLDPTNGIDAAVSFMQGYIIDSDGDRVLGSPIDALLLRCAVLAPDCNGNGRMDTCDLFQGVSLDCSRNGIPDECEPDCNGNGIPDSCDILNGTTADVNHDGIPDSCEQGATRYVDAGAPPNGNGSAAHPFQTLRAGILGSLSGDTLLVRDGVYSGPDNREQSFLGRNIAIKSVNGPANCTIDCQSQGRAFIINHLETAAHVEGLTIQNGGGHYSGGGILVLSATATIANCVIKNCVASNIGAGLFVGGGDSVLRDCTIVQNHTTSAGSNTFGGGLALQNGAIRVENCLIANNTSGGIGGGVWLDPYGSALQMVFSHCVVLDNVASQSGGGIYETGGEPGVLVEHCLIAGNTAQQGGAIAGLGFATITCSTIVGNHATVAAGAMYRTGSAGHAILNSVLWSNTAPSGGSIALVNSGTTLTVSYCDVEGGQAAVDVGPGCTLTWAGGNIALDPRFVDPNGPDGNPLTVDDNNYRLRAASPCIDAGANASVPADVFDLDGDGNTNEPTPFDLDFLPRFKDIPSVPDTGNGTAPIVDIGAYERQP